MHDQEGNQEAAIADYEQALKKCPHFATGFYNKGVAENKLGKHQDALKSFDSALNLEQRADFYHNRGITYKLMGNLELAVKDYTKALQMDPHHKKARFSRSLCFEELGKIEDALDDMVRCLQMLPDDLEIILNTALLEVKLGPKYFEQASVRLEK